MARRLAVGAIGVVLAVAGGDGPALARTATTTKAATTQTAAAQTAATQAAATQAAAAPVAATTAPATATADPLRSGPMAGFSEPREVLLWVQTRQAARVRFVYWDEAEPQTRHATAETTTRAQDAFVAKLVADAVRPGRRYLYEVHVDGASVERPHPLRFQARPLFRIFRGEAPPVRFALGSCYYANDPGDERGWNPGAEERIFDTIADQNPDFMLWLGDNVYLREQDWTTRTGMLERYTQQRELPALQRLLGSTHHYATWDDHDYGPNDADRSFRDKHTAREVFSLFWGNQSYGVPESPGVTTRFAWGDAEFFLLDNRWNRTPNWRTTGERRILGEAQIDWLLDALSSSYATFKFVVIGGQVLNTHRTAETYANFPEERARLIRRIGEERVRGVFLLTGDRHFSELSKLERPGAYPLYDLTVSPLTVSPSNGEREPNALRVPDSFVGVRNFGVIELSGPRQDRRLTLTLRDSTGAVRFTQTIAARDITDFVE
ncbi:MAG: alkaline phosphatase [Vicinamibacteria bacterium]